MYYLGVDLGGTNIACAATTQTGEIMGKYSIPTRLPDTPENIAQHIADCCQQTVETARISWEEIASVGIGTPGITNAQTGVVEYSCNFDFHDVPLAQMVEAILHKPVILENDANAAALGEYVAGSGKGCHSLVAITLGTGVGGGIVLHDRILTGFNFAGAEVGHFVIEKGGEPCNCGRRGCFEAYCSATALIRQTRRAMESSPDSLLWQEAPTLEDVSGRTVFDAAQKGDTVAQTVVDTYIEYLACGLTSIINIFQPEVLCVGGGICNQGENLLAPVRALIDKEDYARDCEKRTRIVRATLGNDAGIIGAALLPLYR